jgi:hypothetical protein
MKTMLSWKRGAFSTTYQIYSNERSIGQLQNRSFKQTSEGRINKKKYSFRTKGVFKQETQIMEGDSKKVIGNIRYNSMMTKATIKFEDRTISWKYDNGRQTRWSLFNENGTLMKFAGRATKGTIECEEADELLVLTGLYITNYYQQAMIAVFVAIFIPIWVTLFN